MAPEVACTSKTTQECKSAITAMAEEYKNAENADTCKNNDKEYKLFQDLNSNCTTATKGTTAIPVKAKTASNISLEGES